jgi:hypothetical protein
VTAEEGRLVPAYFQQVLKRLAIAADISVVFLLVACALAGQQAWRVGFQGPTLALLLAFAPIAASLITTLTMVVVPSLVDAEKLTFAHAITLPAIHCVFTMLIARMMVTRSNAVVAPHEVISPVAYWLDARPLLLLGLGEMVVLALIIALRRRNGDQPVS